MARIPVNAILKATKKAAKEADVMRPGQRALLDGPRKPGLLEEQILQNSPQPEQRTLREIMDSRFPKDAPPIEAEQVRLEAEKLASAQLDDFKLDETFQTNFDTIETTDDVKATIAAVAEANKGRIDEARRGVITNNQLREFAAELDIEEDVVRQVMERESGGILNAETVLAARQVLNSSADRLLNQAKQITAGQATDLDRLTFRRQLQFHREYQAQFMGARAEAGRALNAFKIPTNAEEMQLEMSHVYEMMEAADGIGTDRIAKAMALADNPQGVTKLARKYTQSKVMGVVNENFINSILSGPKTHIINTSGNILMQAMNIAETAIAARIGRFPSAGEHAQIGEASALLHGTLSAWKDGLRLAAKTARTGIPLDDVVKFEGQTRRS